MTKYHGWLEALTVHHKIVHMFGFKDNLCWFTYTPFCEKYFIYTFQNCTLTYNVRAYYTLVLEPINTVHTFIIVEDWSQCIQVNSLRPNCGSTPSKDAGMGWRAYWTIPRPFTYIPSYCLRKVQVSLAIYKHNVHLVYNCVSIANEYCYS